MIHKHLSISKVLLPTPAKAIVQYRYNDCIQFCYATQKACLADSGSVQCSGENS